MAQQSWQDWHLGHGPPIDFYSDIPVQYGAHVGAGALFESQYAFPQLGHPTTLDIGVSDEDDRMLYGSYYDNPNGSHDPSGVRGHMPSMG